MNKLYCIVGESCSGKDTIVKELLKDISAYGVRLLKSNTTRPMRDGEIQGVEYNFSNIHDFSKAYSNDNILEYATYKVFNNDVWHYYTLKSDLKLCDSPMLKIINPLGLTHIRQQLPQDKLVVIYITCDKEIRKQRSISRGDNETEANRRLDQDRKDFQYIKYDYMIENDGSKTIGEIIDIIKKIIKEN